MSPKPVARLMRAAGLTAHGRRRFRLTTDSAHAWPTAPNALARGFAVGAPHQRWAADITALWTRAGWCYLAVVLDLGSRHVVGWALRVTRDRAGPRRAPRCARRPPPAPPPPLGSGQPIRQSGLSRPASRPGHHRQHESHRYRWDNAPVESFFSTLKTELAADAPWATRQDASCALTDYVRFYNHTRLHSALGYRSPADYEAAVAI